MGLDYDELRKIYRFEKNNSGLAEVDGDFFDSLTDFFEKQKKDYLHSLHDLSSSKAKVFSNLRKIITEIFNIREKRIASAINRSFIINAAGITSTMKPTS